MIIVACWNILFDLSNCIVEGNIIGIANQSDIELRTYNVQYTRNSFWYLKNKQGEIKFDIFQSKEMGANITGMGITNTGHISLIYNDYSPNIGAQFILYNKTSHGAEGQNTWIGFERDTLPLMAGQFFYSKDFPTQNNYNFSLFKWDSGDYIWNLYSLPN